MVGKIKISNEKSSRNIGYIYDEFFLTGWLIWLRYFVKYIIYNNSSYNNIIYCGNCYNNDLIKAVFIAY